jgi:outer membrane protein assembly factor BamB
MNPPQLRCALLALLLPTGGPVLAAGDWPMLGGRPDRNMVAVAADLPRDWAAAGPSGPARHVRWAAPLGDVTYGAPVVAAGRVLIGTNRAESSGAEKAGVLRCFATDDGRRLWEAVHPKLADDAEDDSTIGLCSTPCVAGDEVFYVSNRGELVCRDVRDGREIWSLDFRARLGVEVHQASASSPLVAAVRKAAAPAPIAGCPRAASRSEPSTPTCGL